MTLLTLYLVTVITAYFLGSIPFGLLIGKLNKIDIREHGSGNIGATNVLRTLGKKWGYTCFLLDFLKGLLPVLLLSNFAENQDISATAKSWVPAVAMIATVCGHIFSIFLKFKGGKGVATSAGAIMALSPYTILAGLVVWGILFKAKGYVSLASILAGISLPIFELIFIVFGKSLNLPNLIIFSLAAVLVTVMHKSNIKRLREGTEASFKKRKRRSK